MTVEDPRIANSEYVGESLSDDDVRIIHRRITHVEGGEKCEFCGKVRRLVTGLILAVSGAVAIHYLYQYAGWQ